MLRARLPGDQLAGVAGRAIEEDGSRHFAPLQRASAFATDRSAFSQSMRATLAPICAQRQPLAGRRRGRIADGRLNRIPRDQLAEAAFTRNRRHRERNAAIQHFRRRDLTRNGSPSGRARGGGKTGSPRRFAPRGDGVKRADAVNASPPPPQTETSPPLAGLSNNCFWKTGIRASLFPVAGLETRLARRRNGIRLGQYHRDIMCLPRPSGPGEMARELQKIAPKGLKRMARRQNCAPAKGAGAGSQKPTGIGRGATPRGRRGA